MEILYEDASCLAVMKPAGLSTQAPGGIDSLEVRIRSLLNGRAEDAGLSPDDVYLGLPHRLDRPVSGVLLFAKTRRAARKFSRQFERRQVRKIYWACTERIVEPADGTWTDSMRKIPDQPRAELAGPDMPGAQLAVLHYRTLGRTGFGSWLEIVLETGRMHQVRIQAASRGHALLGDRMYGAQTPFGPDTLDDRQRAIALLARSLTFEHPDTHSRMTITAPLGQAWLELGLYEQIAPEPRGEI